MSVLDDENFILHAQACYDSSLGWTEQDFYDDVARFKYLKKLITRYEETGELRERLILNHLVVLSNVFGPYHLVRFLYLKMPRQFGIVKPFLEFLSVLPARIYDVRKEGRVELSEIKGDRAVAERLGEL
jgi:hypothetical protein